MANFYEAYHGTLISCYQRFSEWSMHNLVMARFAHGMDFDKEILVIHRDLDTVLFLRSDSSLPCTRSSRYRA